MQSKGDEELNVGSIRDFDKSDKCSEDSFLDELTGNYDNKSEKMANLVCEQKKTIDQLNDKIEKLQEKVDLMKEEKELLASEMQDMSGSLIEEAHNSILKIEEGRRKLQLELEIRKQNETALKIQNESLRTIIEQNSKAGLSTLKKRSTSGPFTLGKAQNLSENNLSNNNICDHNFPPELLLNIIIYEKNLFFFDEFKEWLQSGCQPNSSFFKCILREDTFPCLTFQNTDLQLIARTYMESWNANPNIENGNTAKEKICEFTNTPCKIHYLINFNSSRPYVGCLSVRLKEFNFDSFITSDYRSC